MRRYSVGGDGVATIALGFRLHTGWAAMVAVSAGCQLYLRRRVELLDGSVPRFVYHTAAEMPLADAKLLIERAEKIGLQMAYRAVGEALEQLKAQNLRVDASAIAVGSAKLPDDLPAILSSHARIHAAEGALFQTAVIRAAKQYGLTTAAVPEKNLWASADARVRARIEAMRSEFGPPWTIDQKIAVAVALAVLRDK